MWPWHIDHPPRAQVNKIVAVISNPLQFKIPAWMLNRQRDVKDHGAQHTARRAA